MDNAILVGPLFHSWIKEFKRRSFTFDMRVELKCQPATCGEFKHNIVGSHDCYEDGLSSQGKVVTLQQLEGRNVKKRAFSERAERLFECSLFSQWYNSVNSSAFYLR